MTTFRTPGDAADLLRSLRARLDHIERHRHPALEQAVLEEGTRPKPPTGVTYNYMTAAGAPAVRTSWTPPTENVDETPLTDLSHYEVEHQVGGDLLYDDPTAVAPTRPHAGLNGLHDTRGTEGVVRGSSGASVRSPDGRDLWLWSDALVGAADGNGSLLEVDRVHNAASWTLGMAQQGDLLGASNLLEGLTLQLSGATAASDASFTVDGYASTALTATAATVQGYFDVPVVPGQRYALMAHHQSAGQSIGWEFRDTGVLSSGSQTITAGRNALLTDAAPANASTLRFLVFSATGRTAGQVVSRFVKAGVFTSEHLMLSWRAPASVEQYTNVFTNPEGRGITAGTYSQLVATNLSANPSFLTGTTGLTGLNSATVSRVVSPSAFAGFAHGRIRRAAAGNDPIFRLASSAVAPGLLTARFRVRRAAPLASSTSTLTVVAQALATSTVLASSPAQVLELDDDWQVVELQVTGPATTNALRVEASASGTAWVASDLVDVDGVEFYQGESPPFYFDGSTSPRDGYVFAWTSTAGSSTSTMTATSTRRINHFRNPRLASATSVAATGGGSVSVSGGAVNVTASAAGQGVRFTHSTSFPVGATVSASVLLRGTGVVRLAINGTPVTLSEPLTLSPGEDRRLSLTMMTTATTTASVDVLAQGVASFMVREPLVEQGLAGDFFHGASTLEDRVVSWEGAVDASRSIASAPTPTGWAPVDATRERLVYDGGMVEVTALKDTSTLRARVSSTALTAGSGTVTATVEAPAGVTVQLEGAFSNASTALSPVILPGDRVRHVFTVPAGATSTRFDVIFTGSFAGGDSVRLGAVTLVQGVYLGPPFTGEMGTTEGAAAAWDGTPHASTSELTLDAADQYLDDRPVSLVAATDAGLPPSHFLRAEDAVVLGSTAYVFMTGYVPLPSASEGFSAVRTGKTYLASFDLTAGAYLDVAEWAAPSAGVWGTAVATDGTWLYVYGLQAGSVQVARTPLADPYTVTYWGGSSWVSSGTPAVVAVGTDGFHGVRQIGTDWVALEIPAPGEALHKWSAVAPQGPFSDDGAQQTWVGLPRRQPRFHPQFDAVDQGIVVSTIDDDAIRFTSGPPGTAHPSFDYEIWGDRQSTLDPEHFTLGIAPNTPYRVRVRAVAETGRFSDWALGDAEIYQPFEPYLYKPAAPVIAAHFRGARVYWSGLDVSGNPFPGFLAFHVHMSTEPVFEPSPSTLVLTRSAPGGTEYIQVDDYRTRYVTVVVETGIAYSVPSDFVMFTPERLSDPDLAGILIDGAKVAKGTLNLEALTVGSFGNSLVANPGFEAGSIADSTRPAAWSGGYARQGGGGTLTPEQAGDFRLDASTVLEGGKSLRIDTLTASSRQVISDPFPIAAGDIYYVAARLRTSTLSADVRITLKMGTTREDVNAEPATAFSQTAEVYTSTGTFTTVHAEGQVEVPDGDGLSEPMHWAAVSVEALHTGSAYSTWVDSVEVRQIVGTASIANAAINNAKIADLAVDDAKISSLDAGKIVTGYLGADRIEAGSLTIAKVGGLNAALAQKTTTFAQDSIPVSTAIGDLWVDTDDNNKMYRAYSVGTSTIGTGHWQLVVEQSPGVVTFAQPLAPISVNIGDLWVDTDDGNKLYRAAQVGTSTIGIGHWEVVAQPETMQTFAQGPPAPVAFTAGDLWVNTANGNKLYRAASAGADAIAAGEWELVGQETVKTFAQDAIPTSLNIGDVWVDTNDGNKLYRAFSVGADAIVNGEWQPIDNTAFKDATDLVNGWRYTGTTKIDGGLIETDTIKAGSIQLGVLSTNLIFDPSFEDDYPLTLEDPFGSWSGAPQASDPTQWRILQPGLGSTWNVDVFLVRDTSGAYARSGGNAIRVDITGNGLTGAGIRSNVFKLTVGKTYRVSVGTVGWGNGVNQVTDVSLLVRSATSPTGFFSDETMSTPVSSGGTGVKQPPVASVDFRMISATFTATREYGYLDLRAGLSFFNDGTQNTVVIDDVSVIEVGVGGSELTGAGLRLFDAEGYESGAFVSNRPQRFSVTSGNEHLGGINELGHISGRRIDIPSLTLDVNGNVMNGAVIYGREFTEWLDMMPRGIIARGERGSAGGATGSTEVPYLQLDARLEGGRQYRVWTSDIWGVNGSSGGRTMLRLRRSTTGPASVSSSQVDEVRRTLASANVMESIGFLHDLTTPTVDAHYSYLITYLADTGSNAAISPSSNRPVSIVVEDMGPAVSDSSIDRSAGDTGWWENRHYTSVWQATATRSYNSDGSVYATDSMMHGHREDSGNMYSYALFTGTAISGETTRTMDQAIDNIYTTLHKVEVFLYARDWQLSTGGELHLRGTTETTLPTPGYVPGGAAREFYGWPDYAGRWVDITAGMGSQINGIVIGATGSTDPVGTGSFDGATQSNPPLIRVEYTRSTLQGY